LSLTFSLSLLVAGCHWTPAQVASLVTGLVQDACPLVGLKDGEAGTVCQEVVGVVSPLVPIVAGASTKPCVLTPITPDGQHGKGVVCASYCGDMSQATEVDPCPRIDAALMGAASAAKAAEKRK
jgi:hypothetical protein